MSCGTSRVDNASLMLVRVLVLVLRVLFLRRLLPSLGNGHLGSGNSSCLGLLWAALTHLCTENRAASLCLYATVILQLHALTVNAAAARPSVLTGSTSSSAPLAAATTGSGSVSVSVNDLNALFRFLALLLSIEDSLADWRVQLLLVGYQPDSAPERSADSVAKADTGTLTDARNISDSPPPTLELSSHDPLEKLFVRRLTGLLDLIEAERERDVYKAYLCIKFIVNSNVHYPRLQAHLEPIEQRWRWLVQWLNEKLSSAQGAEPPAGVTAASSASGATSSNSNSNSSAPLALTYKPDTPSSAQSHSSSGVSPSWSTGSSSNVVSVQPMPRSNSASRPISSRNTDEPMTASDSSRASSSNRVMQRTLSAQHTLNEALALVRRPEAATSATIVPPFAQPSASVSVTASSSSAQPTEQPAPKPTSDASLQPMDTDE